MAKQTRITLVDDLDGSEAEAQVEFALDGRAYEIDLSTDNLARLRETIAPYVSAARQVGGGRRGSSAPARSASDRQQNQAVREWAQQQGMRISERGRIPSNVLEAYHASH